MTETVFPMMRMLARGHGRMYLAVLFQYIKSLRKITQLFDPLRNGYMKPIHVCRDMDFYWANHFEMVSQTSHMHMVIMVSHGHGQLVALCVLHRTRPGESSDVSGCSKAQYRLVLG